MCAFSFEIYVSCRSQELSLADRPSHHYRLAHRHLGRTHRMDRNMPRSNGYRGAQGGDSVRKAETNVLQ
jgi:hypothetical protein